MAIATLAQSLACAGAPRASVRCTARRHVLLALARPRARGAATLSLTAATRRPLDENCSASLKSLLSHTGQQVCILTVSNERGLCGTTVSSFHSCSMDPPMVFFNIGCRSTMDRLLLADGSRLSGVPFVAHVMAERGEPLARFFSQRHVCDDKFDAVKWERSGPPFEQPVLLDGPRTGPRPANDTGATGSQVLGWMECVTEHAIPAGKNWVLIARVERVHCGAQSAGARPLLYCEGAYTGIHSAQAPCIAPPAPAR